MKVEEMLGGGEEIPYDLTQNKQTGKLESECNDNVCVCVCNDHNDELSSTHITPYVSAKSPAADDVIVEPGEQFFCFNDIFRKGFIQKKDVSFIKHCVIPAFQTESETKI